MRTELFFSGGFPRVTARIIFVAVALLAGLCFADSEQKSTLPIEITWGHRSKKAESFFVKLTGQELDITSLKLEQVEPTDQLKDGIARSKAGGGDVDGLSCALE